MEADPCLTQTELYLASVGLPTVRVVPSTGEGTLPAIFFLSVLGSHLDNLKSLNRAGQSVNLLTEMREDLPATVPQGLPSYVLRAEWHTFAQLKLPNAVELLLIGHSQNKPKRIAQVTCLAFVLHIVTVQGPWGDGIVGAHGMTLTAPLCWGGLTAGTQEVASTAWRQAILSGLGLEVWEWPALDLAETEESEEEDLPPPSGSSGLVDEGPLPDEHYELVSSHTREVDGILEEVYRSTRPRVDEGPRSSDGQDAHSPATALD